MITNGKNGRVKRENSLLRLGGASAPPAFNIADLYTTGSYGLYMSVADGDIRDDLGDPASNGEAVATAWYNYYVNGGAPLTRAFEQFTATKRPILRHDGVVKYLDFDGVDDWMQAQSFYDLNSGAVTVIVGLMRDQNTNMEDVLGWGSNPADVNRWRMCATFDASTNNAAFASRGSTGDAGARAADTLVGTKYVLTGLGDISADTSIIRRNGVEILASAADQGTGNYANAQPVFLGARGGTARFFNGRVYALMYINRVLAGDELANAEAWVASKTGVTI